MTAQRNAVPVYRWEEQPVRSFADGVNVRWIDGEGLTVLRGAYRKGAVVAEHRHPQEQMTWVVSGSLRTVVDGEEGVVGAGEVAVIPADVRHESVALLDTEILEVFIPRRDDFDALATER